ncbi:hypothetical protein D3C72_1332890 [compost metagenome]
MLVQHVERPVEILVAPLSALGHEADLLAPVVARRLALVVDEPVEHHGEDDAFHRELAFVLGFKSGQCLPDPQVLPGTLDQQAHAEVPARQDLERRARHTELLGLGLHLGLVGGERLLAKAFLEIALERLEHGAGHLRAEVFLIPEMGKNDRLGSGLAALGTFGHVVRDAQVGLRLAIAAFLRVTANVHSSPPDARYEQASMRHRSMSSAEKENPENRPLPVIPGFPLLVIVGHPLKNPGAVLLPADYKAKLSKS